MFIGNLQFCNVAIWDYGVFGALQKYENTK